MSARVNVQRVFDRLIQEVPMGVGHIQNCVEASVAVAELIEASEKFINSAFPPEFEGCPGEVKQEYRYRHQQLLTALARVGGAG